MGPAWPNDRRRRNAGLFEFPASYRTLSAGDSASRAGKRRLSWRALNTARAGAKRHPHRKLTRRLHFCNLGRAPMLRAHNRGIATSGKVQ